MALPVTFGALAGGPGVTQPLSLLDQNFTALGNLAIIPCSAAGSNSITLTPLSNTPTIASYTSFQPRVAWVQAQTSTGTASANFSGLGSRTIYKNNGLTATGAGDLAANALYWADFNPNLNAGAGGWVLINPPIPTAATAFSWGYVKNLFSTVNSNALVNVTADLAVVSDGISNFAGLFNVNVTPSLNSTGVNGIDTGALAANTWYAVYVIYNPSIPATAGLFSTSFTAPTLPAGYTMFARVGAIRTDGSANAFRTLQKGRTAQYVVNAATNTTAYPGITASFGAYWQSNSISAVVPPTAGKIRLSMEYSGSAANNADGQAAVAPNGQFSSSPVVNAPFAPAGVRLTNAAATVVALAVDLPVELLLESTAVFTGINGGNAQLDCVGWEDNL